MKNNELRSERAKNMIYLSLVAISVSIIMIFYEMSLLSSEGSFKAQKVALFSSIQTIVYIFYNIVMLISSITFIMWFRRAYYNLHLKVQNLSFSEGWAAGCWFVPILNLWRPQKIMKELFNKTIEFLRQNSISVDKDISDRVVGIWWITYIGHWLLQNISLRMQINASSMDQEMNALWISIFASVVFLICGIFTLKLIKDHSKIEDLLHRIEN